MTIDDMLSFLKWAGGKRWFIGENYWQEYPSYDLYTTRAVWAFVKGHVYAYYLLKRNSLLTPQKFETVRYV